MSDNILPSVIFHVFCREMTSELFVSHPAVLQHFSLNLYRTNSGVLHLYRIRHPEHENRPMVELEVYGNIRFTLT